MQILRFWWKWIEKPFDLRVQISLNQSDELALFVAVPQSPNGAAGPAGVGRTAARGSSPGASTGGKETAGARPGKAIYVQILSFDRFGMDPSNFRIEFSKSMKFRRLLQSVTVT